ncbi:head-tail joining protein [Burkholderia gladioli]|uniref:head-tail joining protein n=1 Tax=Burkholderia gladioli TaxID=28095 RepID=UPI00163E1EAD|nr:hypothetical protein [Burkholderia gladioli]
MIDFDGILNAAVSSTLGDADEIVYLPKAGGQFPVNGVFTEITGRAYGSDGEPEANIIVATLGLQVSQLPGDPVQNDAVAVNGVRYVVKDADFDGLGWAYLDLGRT